MPLGLVFVALIIVAKSTSAIINSVQDPAPLGFTPALKQKYRGKDVWRHLKSTYRWSVQIQDNSSDEKGSIFVIDLYQGATLSLIIIVVKSQNETKRL